MDLENFKLHSGSLYIPIRQGCSRPFIHLHSQVQRKDNWDHSCCIDQPFAIFLLPNCLGDLSMLVHIDPPFSFKLMESIPYYKP